MYFCNFQITPSSDPVAPALSPVVFPLFYYFATGIFSDFVFP
jgi:hypothetical protein